MAKTRVTAEELNGPAPFIGDDDTTLTSHTPEYVKSTSNTVGVGLGEVLAAAGAGDNVFNQDGKLLERFSQGTIDAQQIAYTPQRKNEMEGFAQANAALESTGVQQYADPQYREQLKNIAAKAALLPAPDVTTNVEGQKIILSSAVTKIPASFNTSKSREEALRTLRDMVGHEQTIEVVSCARSAGITFVSLPILWLSQMLAVESKRNDLYDDLPRDINYLENVNQEATHNLADNIARLFSMETARQIQTISKIHRVSMLYVLRYLVDKVCKTRRLQVTPDASGGTEFNDLVPRVA